LQRAAAFGFDYLLIAAYLIILVFVGLLLQFASPALSHALFGSAISGELTGFAVLTLPVTLYFAFRRGPDGKRYLGQASPRTAGGDRHRPATRARAIAAA
jgi:hypothetical protein